MEPDHDAEAAGVDPVERELRRNATLDAQLSNSGGIEPDDDAEAAGVDPVERELRRNATLAACTAEDARMQRTAAGGMDIDDPVQMHVGDDTADMSQNDEMHDMSLSMVLVGAALLLCGQGSGAIHPCDSALSSP